MIGLDCCRRCERYDSEEQSDLSGFQKVSSLKASFFFAEGAKFNSQYRISPIEIEFLYVGNSNFHIEMLD